jgi:hypothetical protein
MSAAVPAANIDAELLSREIQPKLNRRFGRESVPER